MTCTICGGELVAAVTDMPFKTGKNTIVILKSLPVWQCSRCPEYLLEDGVLERVDDLLTRVEGQSELEVVSFAA